MNAYPSEVLAIFDKVLHKVATDLSQKDKGQRKEEQRMSYTLHARITGEKLPPSVQHTSSFRPDERNNQLVYLMKLVLIKSLYNSQTLKLESVFACVSRDYNVRNPPSM